MDTTDHPKIKNMSPQLLVADIDISIAFYTEKLGFEVSFLYEDFYAGLSKDGYLIHIKLAVITKAERENRKENEHLDIVFSIEKARDIYETLISRSVTVIQTLRDMPYGHEFYIADPDGYILGFIEEK